MEANFYIIQALTNMHVGSGDANYGVIDNLIQRDPITTLPTIHGSSLKGALREFFETKWKEKNIAQIQNIFGDQDLAGNYRFISAQLLAIPVRSNKTPFFIATAPMVIKELIDTIKLFGKKVPDFLITLKNFKPNEDEIFVFTDTNGLKIEDYQNYEDSKKFIKKDITSDQIEKYLGIENNNLVIFNDNDFKEICSDNNLPVIARNHLENGVSKNLWYEQVVPRKSCFWTMIASSEDKNLFNSFNNMLTNPENLISIGANASVGYGFTNFIKLV